MEVLIDGLSSNSLLQSNPVMLRLLSILLEKQASVERHNRHITCRKGMSLINLKDANNFRVIALFETYAYQHATNANDSILQDQTLSDW